jgi:hypothetical protein
MSTDSESESEVVRLQRQSKEVMPFKWTPEMEDKLEELLMNNYFDFHKTAREFSSIVNKDIGDKWY